MYGISTPLLFTIKTDQQIIHIRKKLLRTTSTNKTTRQSSLRRATHKNNKTAAISSAELSQLLTINNTTATASPGVTSLPHSPAHWRNNGGIGGIGGRSPVIPPSNAALSSSRSSLLAALHPFELQLYNAGLLIDNRRDYTLEDPEQQIAVYNELKNRFRYYKGKRGANRLDFILQSKLNTKYINQGFIKMYEILSKCNLIPRGATSYSSWHFCELPGGFIHAIHNYLHTKTGVRNYSWHGSSLNPKLDGLADSYGFYSRYPSRWDFGVDNTGDITNIKNIEHYRTKCVKLQPMLLTSDCGLPYGNEKYELVAFASLLAILYCCPIGSSFVYKVMTPINLPLIYNLFYICYLQFGEMIIFKPLQNSQSREFYLICKNYTPPTTASTLFRELLGYLQKCNRKNTDAIARVDIYNDTYPAAFIHQMRHIFGQLADVFEMSIRRIIYIQDNKEDITPEFLELLEDYIVEKCHDWQTMFKIRRSPIQL